MRSCAERSRTSRSTRPEPGREPAPRLERGLGLFEAGRWFEAHEVFEALWRAVGRKSDEGRLLQALVQLSASELKREAGGRAAKRLAERAARNLDPLPATTLGIRVAELARRIRDPGRPVQIPLDAGGDLV